MRPTWAITRADPVAAASSVTGWLGLAALAGAWTAYFLRAEPLWAMLAVPLVGVGIAGLVRRPLPSAALVAGAGVVTWASGVSWGNVDMVLPFAIALFAAGRQLAPWAGVVLAGVCIVFSALRDAPSLDTFAVATWLFGSMWAFGRLVGRRAAQARAAVDQARHLSDADPVVLADRRAREERARLANQSLVAVRDAVVEMRASAQRAREELDDDHLDHIRERGAAAVDELRHLLGLLRTRADTTHPERRPAPAPGRSAPGRSAPGRSAPGRPAPGRSGSAPFRALRLLAPVAVIAVLLIAHPHWDRSVALSALYLGGLAALALGVRTPTGGSTCTRRI